MFQVPGGHSLAGIPGGGFQRGTDFQPPYFPPPFSQQGMEVFNPIQVIPKRDSPTYLTSHTGSARHQLRPLQLRPAQYARLPPDQLDPGFQLRPSPTGGTQQVERSESNHLRQVESEEVYQAGLNHAFLAPEVPLAIKKELGRAGNREVNHR